MGTTICDLLVYALTRYHQIPIPEARSKIWLFDSKGLVVRDRMHDLQVGVGFLGFRVFRVSGFFRVSGIYRVRDVGLKVCSG
jgi:hypothetical protein